MRAAIIFNPTKIDESELAAALLPAERANDYASSKIIPTRPDYSATEAAADAIADGVDLVIACGGDGTVREAAAALAETKAPVALGIVPLGTGNLLARNLGIDPRQPLQTHFEIAFGGTTRPLDACELNATLDDGSRVREWFMVMAGMGIDAGMIQFTDEDKKQRFGWLAYLGGVARTLRKQPMFTARYRVDSEPTYGVRASSMLLLNCGQLQGGITLAPDATFDDGMLDVVIVRPRGPLGWLELLGQGMLRSISTVVPPLREILLESDAEKQVARRYSGNRAITGAQGAGVSFAVDSDAEPFQLDGDLLGRVRDGLVVVHHDALNVRAPAVDETARLVFGLRGRVAR